MTGIYVRSTDGLDTDDGTTWDLAKATLVGAAAIDAAGDDVFVSPVHAETSTALVTLAFAGTPSLPTRITCVGDASAPPTATATGASFSTTGSLTITGSVYMENIILASTGTIALGSTAASLQHFKSCAIRLNHTSAGQINQVAPGAAARTVFEKSTLRFNAAGNTFQCGARMHIKGGGIEAGSATPTTLFRVGAGGRAGSFMVEDFDFTPFAATFNMFDATNSVGSVLATVRNCKLPVSWSGLLVTGVIGNGMEFEMLNCTAGSTKIRAWKQGVAGQVRDDTAVVRTGGAVDDAAAYSIKAVASADAKFPSVPLECAPISQYVNAASTTLTLELAHEAQGSGAGGALRNDEFALRVTYPGGVVDTVKVDTLVPPADLPPSSAAWTGLASPVKQKISVTFTPSAKGEARVTPILYAAGKTVYYCQLLGA